MSRLGKIALSCVGVLALGSGVAYLVLPGIVAKKIVAAAKEKGFDVTLGSVSVGLHTITASDLTVAAPAIPELHVTAKSAQITLESFEPTSLSIEGATVSLNGGAAKVRDEANVLAASPSPSALPVTVAGTLDWKAPFGDASAAHCDALSVSVTDGAKVGCGGLHVTWGSLVFGPWKLDVGHGATDSLSLDLQPDHPGRASITWSRSAGLTHVAATFPETTVDALGVPPLALSLVSLDSAPTADLSLVYDESSSHAARGSMSLKCDRFPVGQGRALPVQIRAIFDGDPTSKIHVVSQTAVIAGFSGALTGDVELAALRAHLFFDAVPMACSDAARQVAAEAFGGLGQMAGDLATALGAGSSVSGSVKLTADLDVDLHDLGKAKLTPHTTGECQLALFPP